MTDGFCVLLVLQDLIQQIKEALYIFSIQDQEESLKE